MSRPVNTIVIGIGSPFGEDQLGWHVVEQLRKQLAGNHYNNIRFEVCDRPGTLLIDHMRGVEKVILIDAIDGGTPGTVRTIHKQQLLRPSGLHSSHQLGVAETIALGDKLGLLPADLTMYGIETGGALQQCPVSVEVINSIANSVAKEMKTT